ncbi:MAG: hypothetical protein AAFY50_01255 [Cyanobacteria bacterium J06648_1]
MESQGIIKSPGAIDSFNLVQAFSLYPFDAITLRLLVPESN